MVIRLDENYNAMTSTALLGYVGETNARPVSVEGMGLSTEDFQPKKATKVDELEAQVLYTALMTDTLIEESDDNV